MTSPARPARRPPRGPPTASAAPVPASRAVSPASPRRSSTPATTATSRTGADDRQRVAPGRGVDAGDLAARPCRRRGRRRGGPAPSRRRPPARAGGRGRSTRLRAVRAAHDRAGAALPLEPGGGRGAVGQPDRGGGRAAGRPRTGAARMRSPVSASSVRVHGPRSSWTTAGSKDDPQRLPGGHDARAAVGPAPLAGEQRPPRGLGVDVAGRCRPRRGPSRAGPGPPGHPGRSCAGPCRSPGR